MNGNDRKSQKFPAVASCVAAIPQLTHRLSCPAVITTRGLPRTPIPGGDSLVLTAEQAVSHRSIHPRPSANAAPMPHMQLEHFFSYDSDTTVGTIGTNSATKNLFLATDVFRLSATISTTTVKPGILRTDQENQSQIQMTPFSRPMACPQSEYRRKLAQSCGRNKICRKKIRRCCQGADARYKSPASLAPFSTPVGTLPQAGPKLQSEQSQHHEG